MKTFADYMEEESVDLVADIIEPAARILGDKKVIESFQKKPMLLIAKDLLKAHKKDVLEIVHRIDPEPVNGVNLITQLLVLLNEVAKDEALMDFFKSQGQKMEKGSSGSVMASTEEGED